jgi:hypothetical protein
LHVGEVFYGNVGSHERLDFTVIGPAVNEVSRIAAMYRSVDQPVLTSEAFAKVCDMKNRLVCLFKTPIPSRAAIAAESAGACMCSVFHGENGKRAVADQLEYITAVHMSRGKSPFAQDCVVGLGGLELLTKRLFAETRVNQGSPH